MTLQVQLAEAFERFWGRFGDRHLCVSNAMKDELQKHWSIKATVFYDRPPAQFEPTPLAQKVCPARTPVTEQEPHHGGRLTLSILSAAACLSGFADSREWRVLGVTWSFHGCSCLSMCKSGTTGTELEIDGSYCGTPDYCAQQNLGHGVCCSTSCCRGWRLCWTSPCTPSTAARALPGGRPRASASRCPSAEGRALPLTRTCTA